MPNAERVQGLFKAYVETVSRVHGDSHKRYIETTSTFAEAVRRIAADAAAMSPLAKYGAAVVRAYASQDAQAWTEVVRSLATALQEMRSAYQARYEAAVRSYVAALQELYREARGRIHEANASYSGSVRDAWKALDPRELDPTTAAVIGHGLWIGAAQARAESGSA